MTPITATPYQRPIIYTRSAQEQALYLVELFTRRNSPDGERDAFKNAAAHCEEMISYTGHVEYWQAVQDALIDYYEHGY